MKLEFEKRNKNLPLEKHIFNIQILRNLLNTEREQYLKQFEDLNNLLNPKKFIKYKNNLTDNLEKLDLINCNDLEKKIQLYIIELQKQFLECFKIKIKNSETKSEIINLFYEFRYYGKIPFDTEKNISKISQLNKEIDNIYELLIKKAYALKAINVFAGLEELNYKIIKNIFITRVINLTDLYIELSIEKNKLYMQLYDEDMLDNKFEIDIINKLNIEKLELKLNKKIKVFI